MRGRGGTPRHIPIEPVIPRPDPKRAVAAIVKAVESENPPLRLLLGASTIPRLQSKIDAQLKDLETWRETTIGADFPAGE